MIKRTDLIAPLLLSLLFLAGCNSGGGTTDTDTDQAMQLPDTIKIGFIGPLTGDAAGYGQDVKKGISFYFAEHPTISGKKVEVIYEDGKCNGQDAANAAQKLITIDKVQVILGGQCSGETLAAAPIAEQNKVVMLSALSSSPDVSTAGDYIFRNYPSDKQVSQTLVDDVLVHHTSVALLTEQSDYAQGYRKAINENFKNAGKTLVLDEAFAASNTDFRTLLTKVKESKADALIFVGQAPVTGGFAVKQAKELGLTVQFYGTDTTPGLDFFSTAKDAAEGTKAVYVAEDPSRTRYNEVMTSIGATESAKVFPLFGYDGAAIIANAIASVGYDGTAIKDYLYKMPSYSGVASDVAFDKNGDNQTSAAVRVAKNGEFVFAK